MGLFSSISNWFSGLFSSESSEETLIKGGTPLSPKAFVAYGINKYPDPSNNLFGCVNDAYDWTDYATNTLKFPQEKCRLLLDQNATKANIMDAWSWALEGIKPGDLVFLTGSSHGAQVLDQDGDEPDGLDEVICTYDFNWNDSNKYISDDEIAKLCTKIPNGALVIMIMDCCHSGTMNRNLGQRSRGLVTPAEILNRIPARCRSNVRSLGRAAANPGEPYNFVLMTGCKSNQYSYDSVFNGRNNGAFTYNALQLLKRLGRNNTVPTLGYSLFIRMIQRSITEPQTPQLNCTENLKRLPVFTRGL